MGNESSVPYDRNQNDPKQANVSSSDSESESGNEANPTVVAQQLEQVKAVKTPRKKKPKKGSLKIFHNTELRNEIVVGEGGFGRVLQGIVHGGPVAIKIFHAPLDIKKVQQKLGTLTRLQHRNIVHVLGIINSAEIDCPQVILQYYPEGNLREYLSKKENHLDNGHLRKLAVDILSGCEYLHSKNIVHGNLAARNILIQKSSNQHKVFLNAKVTDYGIIEFAEGSGGNYMKVHSGLTVPIRWAPKELIEDDGTATGFSFQSDYWSFGVLLWEMSTKGAIPYGASYSNVRVVKFLKDGYSPLKVHRPTGCPQYVVDIMERVFEVDPTLRQSFTALIKSFSELKMQGGNIDKNTSQNESGKNKESKQKTQKTASKSTEVTQKSSDQHGVESDMSDNDLTTDEPSQEQSKKKRKNKKKKDKVGNEDAQEEAENDPTTDDDHNQDQNQSKNKKQKNKNKKEKEDVKKEEAESGQMTIQIKKPSSVNAAPVKKQEKKHVPKDNEKSQTQSKPQFTPIDVQKLPNQHPKQRQEQERDKSQTRKHNQGQQNWQPRHGQEKPYRYSPNYPHQHSTRGGANSCAYPGGSSGAQRMQNPANMTGFMPNVQSAPPPYSPNPLPNHYTQYNEGAMGYGGAEFMPQYQQPGHNPGYKMPPPAAAPVVDLEQQIKAKEMEITRLKTEQMAQELLKKSAEVAEIMQKMTEHKLTTQDSAGTGEMPMPGGGDGMARGYHRGGYNPSQHRGQGRSRGRGGGGRGFQS